MNNIQKAFKQKAKMGLRMAVGGVVPYGTLTNSDGSISADSMEHPLNNVSMVDKKALGVPLSGGSASKAAGILNARQNMISASIPGGAKNVFAGIGMPNTQAAQTMQPAMNRAERNDQIEGTALDNYGGIIGKLRSLGMGMKEGGIVQDFTGKGRPDKDTVPAMLAHGEAVLPANTVRTLGGPEAVEELIETTNGKPSATAKKGLRDDGVMYAEEGGLVKPEKKKVVLRSTPYLQGGATNSTQDEYTTAVNGPEAGSRTQVGVINGGPGVGVYGATPVQEPVQKAGTTLQDAAGNFEQVGTGSEIAPGSSWPKIKDAFLKNDDADAAKKRATVTNPEAAKLTEAESIAAENMRDARMTQLATTPRNTLSDAQLAVMDKVIPDRNAQPTLKNGAWTSKNDVTAEYNQSLAGTAPGDPRRLQDGHGIASMRQADGSYKNIVVTPTQYTGADGKPTNNWYDTQAYKDGVARAEKQKQTLRNMQIDRHMRSLDSPNAAWRADGLRNLAVMMEQDKIANTNAKNSAESARWNIERSDKLRENQRSQDNADRTYEAGRDDKFKARVDDLLKSMSTVDGKVDNQMYSNLQKYASQIPREIVRDEKTGAAREMDDNEYFAWLSDNFAVDQITGDAGTHYLTPEKNWMGERTQWKKGKAGMSRILHGSPMQDVAYEDPVSGRVVYASDIAKMSPQQQRVFMSRVN